MSTQTLYRKTFKRKRRWFNRTIEEIYAYRTDKPAAVIRLPLFGRHWAYAGRTCNGVRRDLEHLTGGGRYNTVPKPWADLAPTRYVIFRRKRRMEITTKFLEVLTIRVLLPVYNVEYNRGNPRRIKPYVQKAQRAARNERNYGKILFYSMRPAIPVFVTLLIIGGWFVHR